MNAASLLLLALSAATGPAAPGGTPVSLAIVVGSNRGTQPGRAPLAFADDDAAKYYEVFSALAGEEGTALLADFDRDTARLFPTLLEKARSPTRAQLDLATAKLARRAAEVRQAGARSRLYFVFAGHGDVEDGRGYLELADGPFTADDLEALVRTIGASETHLILDSCSSFFVVNPRRAGGTRFPTPREAAEALGKRLPDIGVFLSTSAQAEVYEWSELQSGVFSHAVRSGLLGAADADGDGAIRYEELAAFVATAVADIKNPLYRPTVYARGPNGNAQRAIFELPPAPRSALVVDDPGTVRLAVRDRDGLRWADAHKEGGAELRLWFPAALTSRLEIDRLREGGGIEGSFDLPAGEPRRLEALLPSSSTVALRGAGDIFRTLFSRPFGPRALAAYRDRAGTMDLPPALGAIPRRAPDPGVPAEAGAAPDVGPRRYAALRPALSFPWFDAGGGGARSPSSGAGAAVAAAAGQELGRWLAIELEAGYREVVSSGWSFPYPSVGYVRGLVEDTRLRFQSLPVAVNLRAAPLAERVRPYALIGGGVAPTLVTVDPPRFDATLRETRVAPFAHAGVGVELDVTGRFFAGAEARFSFFPQMRVFDARIGILGATVGAVLGARL